MAMSGQLLLAAIGQILLAAYSVATSR